MKMNIKAKGTKPHRRMQNWLRHQMGQIEHVLDDGEAEIVLERNPRESPPYCVRMRLNDADSEIAVESRGASLQKAAAKAVRKLGVQAWTQTRSWVPRRNRTKRNLLALQLPEVESRFS